MNRKLHTVFFFLFLIFAFGIIIRFYKFDSIPGEWFGDISNVHEYVSQILTGKWPFYFFQSPGPLYHYLIAPIVLLYRNHGYETYKAASILISLIGLVGTYFFVKEIAGKKVALFTTLTMSFSFWYLVWSRLGNSQIVIPALTALMSLFVARYVKKRRLSDLSLGAVFASLGWYTYPQTFILPAVFFLFIIVYLIFQKKLRLQIKSLGFTLILMIIMVMPFINTINHDKGNFGPKGYVGEKVLPVLKLPIDQLIGKTLSNWQKVLFMLHVRGDKTFRVNVSSHPQLDEMSGIFFLLGFLYFLNRKRRIWLFYILWMLLILPLPSISPAIPDAEIPNSARTIAITPFVFLMVSTGFLWSFGFLRKNFNRKYLIASLITVIYMYTVYANLRLYFVDYTNGLPDKNFASGKIIANYIDNLPSNINIYFGSCCWGEWGHPEPKAVAYVLQKPRNFIEYSHYLSSCREVTRFPALVILGPNDDKKEEEYKSCFPELKKEELRGSSNEIIFNKIYIEKGPV